MHSPFTLYLVDKSCHHQVIFIYYVSLTILFYISFSPKQILWSLYTPNYSLLFKRIFRNFSWFLKVLWWIYSTESIGNAVCFTMYVYRQAHLYLTFILAQIMSVLKIQVHKASFIINRSVSNWMYVFKRIHKDLVG